MRIYNHVINPYMALRQWLASTKKTVMYLRCNRWLVLKWKLCVLSCWVDSNYVSTFRSKCKFCLDLGIFIILCRGLFLPEFLSNRLQTLVQWSLGFGEVCYDFSKNSQLCFWIYSGFSGSLSANKCLANDVHVGGLYYNALFPPDFLSNWLQTLAQWSSGPWEVWCDFFKAYIMFFRIYPGLSGSLCGPMLVQWCTFREKLMKVSWPVNIGAHCQRRHNWLALFEYPLHLIN